MLDVDWVGEDEEICRSDAEFVPHLKRHRVCLADDAVGTAVRSGVDTARESRR